MLFCESFDFFARNIRITMDTFIYNNLISNGLN